MTLLHAQFEFVKSLTRLFTFIELNGYKCSLGEAWRPEWVAKMNAQAGRGIERSLHCDRLAIDINLFKDDVLLAVPDDYRLVGEFWESLTVPELNHWWGGRWNDAGHFSVSLDKRK